MDEQSTNASSGHPQQLLWTEEPAPASQAVPSHSHLSGWSHNRFRLHKISLRDSRALSLFQPHTIPGWTLCEFSVVTHCMKAAHGQSKHLMASQEKGSHSQKLQLHCECATRMDTKASVWNKVIKMGTKFTTQFGLCRQSKKKKKLSNH